MYILPQLKKTPHGFGYIQRYKFQHIVMVASFHEAIVSLFKQTNNDIGCSKTIA